MPNFKNTIDFYGVMWYNNYSEKHKNTLKGNEFYE